MSDIIITPEYEECMSHIAMGASVVFVNGRAGTGKSVLIDVLTDNFKEKEIVKLAPTGIAALNVYGQTIHSLFRFPFGVLTDDLVRDHIRKMWDYDNGVLENVDMIIIDEISMVRADVMDAIDKTLRGFRDKTKPFGGVQLVIVGDLFQLPPVLTDEDQKDFEDLYESEFFFSSNAIIECMRLCMMEIVTLTQTFRQKDEIFINVLNDMRLNMNRKKCVKILNHCCYHNPEHLPEESAITLCTTNMKASHINDSKLHKLPGELMSFKATTTGTFNLKMITPELLKLKIGAKVMFTKNGELWVNGSMGVVEDFADGGIMVRMADEDTLVFVKQEKWEIIKTYFNRTTYKMDEYVMGSFTQYPLALAWAVTIHKSQGLTFDHVKLDLGKEAFAAGQTYVGFSRCRTLDGIELMREMIPADIKVDRRVVEFFDRVETGYFLNV